VERIIPRHNRSHETDRVELNARGLVEVEESRLAVFRDEPPLALVGGVRGGGGREERGEGGGRVKGRRGGGCRGMGGKGWERDGGLPG
jgi:hypothetical protein